MADVNGYIGEVGAMVFRSIRWFSHSAHRGDHLA